MEASSEEWRATRYSGYEVSNLGRVRSLTRLVKGRDNIVQLRTGRILKLRMHTHGYLRVQLGADNEEYVHRLVCEAFHGCPKSPDLHADHINGVRADNRVENLRWLEPEANRALRKFPRGSQRPEAKINEATAARIKAHTSRHRGEAARLGRELGVSAPIIRQIWRGVSWRYV